MRALLAAAVLTLASGAFAQNAQDELEQQLKDMVGKPPTKLHVEYEGLDQPNYKLVEVSFTLDGQALPVPAVEKLNEGKTTIWHGDIKPGHHRLETAAVFTDVSGVLFSYESGYKWNVKKSIGFDQQPGLEVHLLVTPDVNPSEKDPKKKFDLKSTHEVKMLAKLEDGSMPDSPKPNLGSEGAADAGAQVGELTPAEKARQAAAAKAAVKKAAAEEAKRKRAEALAEKKRQREEALAAKKAAAEEAKRQRAEALAAKKAAASGKVAAAEKTERVEKTPTAEKTEKVEPAPEPLAAKEPEVVDAGAPVVAVERPKPAAPAPPPPVAEGRSTMVPVILGIAVALLGVVVFFATRRKKRPPSA